MSWRAAPGSVIRYRLSYIPLSGVGGASEAQTVGAETTIVLQELFPITTYRVSVSAEYASGIGDEMQVEGTTKEGELGQHVVEVCQVKHPVLLYVYFSKERLTI